MKKLKLDKIVIWEYTCKRIPIIQWLPKYGLRDTVSDLIAGFTVGLTLMPQAIAYAALAGLEPQYGLYSAFAGSFVYIIFGTIKEVNIGPTAIISLLTFNYTHDTNPHFVVLLCFLSGVVELLCGILHLGFIIEFVSVPVAAGFSSAAAVIAATSQLKGMLGLSFHSENFIGDWVNIIWNLSETRLWDLCLSVGCCTILLLMRQLKNIKFEENPISTTKKIFNDAIWFLSISRNAIIVLMTATIAYVLTRHSLTPFILTGKVESGLPGFSLPPTSTVIGNTTYTFLDMCTHLGTGIIFVPLVSILANIAIAKAFADGKIIDATQEMMTLGLCNIIGSLFQSMPVAGAFSRSAVNNASGVRTPLGGLYTGLIIVLALDFLTPYFFYIPKATLASVIVCAVIFMVEVKLVSHIWKTNKKDLIPLFVTFGACLWQGVEMGILLGLLIDILYLLYLSARPSCTSHKLKDTYSQEYIVVSPSSGLLFPAVDHIREQVILASKDSFLPVVLDFKHVLKIDYTGIEGLKALKEDMKKTNQRLFFQNVQSDILNKLKQRLGSDVSTINALGELLQGGRKISGSDLFIGGRKISSSLIRPEILGQAISDIEKDPTLLGRLRKYSRMGDLLYSHQEKSQF